MKKESNVKAVKNFEPEKSSDSGKCMGYMVQAEARCDQFGAKNKK